MFSEMISGIEEESVEMVFKIQPARPERFKGVFSSLTQQLLHPEVSRPQPPIEEAISPNDSFAPGESPKQAPQTSGPKVGRNDPCPCGSGKKYKKCCGR
jgi:preprotein translocase subunit SecA